MRHQLDGAAPARLTIDLDAIAHNVEVLRSFAGEAQVMAVVKADAYGHGLLPVARAAQRAGATWLGVAQLAEALALRAGGIDGRVISWLHAPGSDFGAAILADIDLGVPSVGELSEVVEAASAVGRPARVHLKADTGLGRNGAYGADWDALCAAAASAAAVGSVNIVGVFTHFASADVPDDPSVDAQLRRFAEVIADCERAGFPLEVRHAANSAATLLLPQAHFDLVRTGIAMYGMSPAPQIGDHNHFGLRPAMTLSANATVTKRVPAGQGVSYGHTYVTSRETTLLDVPCGYADGIPRHASSKGPVWINGERFTVAGRVCMDQFVVDVGDLPVAAGDRIVLFGDGQDGVPTAQDWAQACDTISYEILARMSSRLPRVYRGVGA